MTINAASLIWCARNRTLRCLSCDLPDWIDCGHEVQVLDFPSAGKSTLFVSSERTSRARVFWSDKERVRLIVVKG